MLYSLTKVHCPGDGEFLFIRRAGSLTKEEVPEPPETLIMVSASPAAQTIVNFMLQLRFLFLQRPRPHTLCCGRHSNENDC